MVNDSDQRYIILKRAKALRGRLTRAEQVLWRYLRANRLGGFHFRCQHPLGNFIVDFACLRANVIVEVDGGIHRKKQRYDAWREGVIKKMGFRVLRFPNEVVENQLPQVLETILAACQGRPPDTQPSQPILDLPQTPTPPFEKSYSIAKIRLDHPNAYRPWSEIDEARLRILWEQGLKIPEISVELQRQPGGIQSRLKRLGLSGITAKLPVASVQSTVNYPHPQYETIQVLGDLRLFSRAWLAIFCSVRSPGSLILQAHDLALALREVKVPMAGGFHSPIEKDILEVLLRGYSPLLVCPARSLEGMRIPANYRQPIDDGRLALVSFFSSSQSRASVELATERNRRVAQLAERVLVIHADPTGKLTKLCQEIISWRKPLYTLQDEHNQHLFEMGARGVKILEKGVDFR